MERPKVAISVAIPCYGRRDTLRATLDRIAACSPAPSEILIHADGGWDPELSASEIQGIPMRIFRSATNVGPGGGRHLMIYAAQNDIVASFDDDSWPLDNDYFAKAHALMEAFPKALVLSPAVYLKEKPLLDCMPEVIISRSFEGSASVHRRSLYLQLPGYVPVPAAYGVEEADLSLQAHAAHMLLLSSPWLRAWHDRPNADDLHSVQPWIKNEVLLGYLRFPRFMQPWAWWRAIRHVVKHRHQVPLGKLVQGLASSLSHCTVYERYRHRYPASDIWRHYGSKQRRWVLTTKGAEIVSKETAPDARRVVYLQYTNPASYPPLEHSSQNLAQRGWEVLFLGLRSLQHTQLSFPPHPRITERYLWMQQPGVLQKLHFAYFALWAAIKVQRFKADCVYASDPLSTPIALCLSKLGYPVIFHEHDSPTTTPNTASDCMTRLLMRQRQILAKRAEAVVLPNAQRLEVFVKETGAVGAKFCVWNCPSVDEIAPLRTPEPDGTPLRLLYHGSINPYRFPKTILHALKLCGPGVIVRLVGYETVGSMGYTAELRAEAEQLGVSDQFETLGTIPQRSDLMARCRECHAGLSLLQISGQDINMQHMAGASNKPFDYLSQGLALIVPPDPVWEAMFVETGCAVSCAMDDANALAKVFAFLRDNRAETLRMGRTGQELVRSTWNYEEQFRPVLQLMDEL